MAHDDDDGAVGYKKPPKAHQFKPGQSGNPSGRRKAQPTFANDLADELRESITLHEKGREEDYETAGFYQDADGACD